MTDQPPKRPVGRPPKENRFPVFDVEDERQILQELIRLRSDPNERRAMVRETDEVLFVRLRRMIGKASGKELVDLTKLWLSMRAEPTGKYKPKKKHAEE